MLLEIFKMIDGYNYQISNYGRVFDVTKNRFVIPYIHINDKGKKYMRVNVTDKNGKQNNKQIHRLIAFIDHKNGNGLDNNMDNLRWVTQHENNMNQKQPENRFKGVYENGINFIVQIRYNKRKYHLGTYITQEEAALVYNIAAKLLFNDYACFNIVEKTENYKQLKYLTFHKLSKHFDNIDDLVEKYKKYA